MSTVSMQSKVARRTLLVNATAAKGQKLVSPVAASRRNAMLGIAGACAGLLVPFQASAGQPPQKVELSVPRAESPYNKAYVPGVIYQKYENPNAGGLVYVGRRGGPKRT